MFLLRYLLTITKHPMSFISHALCTLVRNFGHEKVRNLFIARKLAKRNEMLVLKALDAIGQGQ